VHAISSGIAWMWVEWSSGPSEGGAGASGVIRCG
jgi:hypothetical protein